MRGPQISADSDPERTTSSPRRDRTHRAGLDGVRSGHRRDPSGDRQHQIAVDQPLWTFPGLSPANQEQCRAPVQSIRDQFKTSVLGPEAEPGRAGPIHCRGDQISAGWRRTVRRRSVGDARDATEGEGETGQSPRRDPGRVALRNQRPATARSCRRSTVDSGTRPWNADRRFDDASCRYERSLGRPRASVASRPCGSAETPLLIRAHERVLRCGADDDDQAIAAPPSGACEAVLPRPRTRPMTQHRPTMNGSTTTTRQKVAASCSAMLEQEALSTA